METKFTALEDKERLCQCMECRCCQRSIEERKEKPEASELSPDDLIKNRQPLATEIATFEDKTAVTVVRNGNQFEYKISYEGKDKILVTTDASAKGLEEAEKKIAALTDAKQKELETTFSVAFSKTGDDVAKQWVEKPDCTWEKGVMVKARSPSLIELYGIEAALYRCQPSHITVNGNGVKFHFLESNLHKDQPVLAYFVSSDKDKRPSVYFEPGANKNKPATELDSDRFDRSRQMSIEALTTHELSHNHQAKTSWDTVPAEAERISKLIGWVPFVDVKSGSTEYLLRGKTDGEFYRYGKDNCKDARVWVKSDKDGNPLNEKGEKAGSFKAAKHYSGDEIADKALVKPLTYYFPNPTEMFAEGLMLFRLGNKCRAKLLHDSPAQYAAVKAQDQVEIDQRYGKNDTGQSNYIRAINGTLKKNSEAERKAIQEFENKNQAMGNTMKNDAMENTNKSALVKPRLILPMLPLRLGI